MKAVEFCYWLQGLFEVAEPKELNEKQTEIIKRHLNLVFLHEIDPSYSADTKVQEEMQAVHDGKSTIRVIPITGITLTDNELRPSSWPGRDSDGELMRC